MSNEKDRQVLGRIVERLNRTMAYCEDQTFESFQMNLMLQEACVFNILQIGELSKQGLSDFLIEAHPNIPWHQIYGMRNRIVHGYEGVRLRVVWETITESFPALALSLHAILEAMS